MKLSPTVSNGLILLNGALCLLNVPILLSANGHFAGVLVAGFLLFAGVLCVSTAITFIILKR